MVNRAGCSIAARLVPEEGARIRQLFQDTPVQEKLPFVRIHRDPVLLTGLVIGDEEGKVPALFRYAMDEPEADAAFPAPDTFERQGDQPC